MAGPPGGTGDGVERLWRSFDHCRQQGRAALIAFLAAGDPDLATTEELAAAAAAAGADVIELGVPFSDPLADGPIIQAAYTRALAAGATLEKILDCVRRIVARGDPPVILMSAYNPVLAYGLERFCRDASAAGAAGVLIPDLLPEDAGELRENAARHGLATVFLAAPDTSESRLAAAARASTGFLYLVSRRGVTGPGGGVGGGIEREIARARAHSTVPIAVGFGVATPEDARRVAAAADAVIVGSALVDAAAAAALAAEQRGEPAGMRRAVAAAAVRQRVQALAQAIRETAPATGVAAAAAENENTHGADR